MRNLSSFSSGPRGLIILAASALLGVAGAAEPAPPAQAAGLRSDRFGNPLPERALFRIGTTWLRHAGIVNRLAFTPDGKLLVTADQDNLCFWDTRTGREVRRIPICGPDFAVSGDGQTVAARVHQGKSRKVCVWSTSTGDLLHVVEKTDPTRFAFSADGKVLNMLLDGSGLYRVKLASGTDRFVQLEDYLEYFADEVKREAIFSSDGRILAVYSRIQLRNVPKFHPQETHRIFIWDVAQGRKLGTWGTNGQVQAMAISRDGRLLACAHDRGDHDDRYTIVWELPTGKRLRYLEDQLGPIAFSPDGQSLAIGGRLWDWKEGERPRHLGDRASGPVAFSPDGRSVAVADSTALAGSCRISLLDPATGKECLPYSCWVSDLMFAPDSRSLIAVEDGVLQVRDAGTGQHLRQLSEPGAKEELAMRFSPDGRTMALLHQPKARLPAAAEFPFTIQLLDWATGKQIRQLQGNGWDVVSLAGWSADAQTLATHERRYHHEEQDPGTDWERVRLWDATSGRELKQFRNDLAMSSDDVQWVAVGRLETPPTERKEYLNIKLELLDPSNKRGSHLSDCTTGLGWTLPDRTYGSIVFLPCFSPDGRLLASATPQCQKLRVLETATGKVLAEFRPEEYRPSENGFVWFGYGKPTWPARMRSGALFSPDSESLLLRNPQDVLHLFQASSGRLVRSLWTSNQAKLQSAQFSPDGRLVAAAYANGQAVLWEVLSGHEVLRLPEAAPWLLFSPDGAKLATIGKGSALVFDLADRTNANNPLTVQEVEQLWSDLAGDGPPARRAIWRLAAAPAQTLPWLRERLRPAAPPAPGHIARLIADLDNERFEVREKAELELSQLEMAEPALRRALADRPPLEVARRLQAILARIPDPGATPARRQILRTVEVLERMATPEARQLLVKLAGGVTTARETREAQAVLRRWQP